MRVSNDRTWTTLLNAAGSRVVTHPQFEHSMTRRKLIAEMVLHAITSGEVHFINGTTIQIGSKEWVDFVKWLYVHIDGPAPQKVQMSTPAGESLKIEDVTLDNDERLRRITAILDAARARVAGSAANNGQASPNGVHASGLEYT